jgi:Fe-S cluster assembly protein SufB
MRDENQLHAAVVELVALERRRDQVLDGAELVPGRRERRRRHLQLRDQARRVPRRAQQDQLDPGRDRLGDHLEVPELRAAGDDSVGEFYSVALTHHRQQADTGTKMIHLGKRTKSKIISKGISAGRGQNTYRGLVQGRAGAEGARNYTQCDSLLIGKRCGAHTFPYIEVKHPDATVEHEATTSKISDDQLFYCRSRGIGEEDAVSMIVDGFCKQVFRELPMEFAVEAKKLLEVSSKGRSGERRAYATAACAVDRPSAVREGRTSRDWGSRAFDLWPCYPGCRSVSPSPRPLSRGREGPV